MVREAASRLLHWKLCVAENKKPGSDPEEVKKQNLIAQEKRIECWTLAGQRSEQTSCV